MPVFCVFDFDEFFFFLQIMNGKNSLLLISAENGDLNGLIHALDNDEDIETRDAVSYLWAQVFHIFLKFLCLEAHSKMIERMRKWLENRGKTLTILEKTK